MNKEQTTLIPAGLSQEADSSFRGLLSKEGALAFSDVDWQQTPQVVRVYVLYLCAQIEELNRRMEQMEALLHSDSNNSNKPPSSDSPFQKKELASQERRSSRPGGKKGHPGHRQEMLEPTETVELEPKQCSCGNGEFIEIRPFYTHQFFKLPEISMEVIHFILHEGRCTCCGKVNKADLPPEVQSGYDPRLSALIGEMSGNQGNSRATVQGFCSSVLGIHISRGAIQKIIDRVSEAIKPHYEAIGEVARAAKINYIDETPWLKNGVLIWLWAMVNTTVAYFLIHPHRSKEAFAALIEGWVGILVSDGYGVYQKWVELRQTCLGHLIRKARALCQRANPEIAAFGAKALAELQRCAIWPRLPLPWENGGPFMPG